MAFKILAVSTLVAVTLAVPDKLPATTYIAPAPAPIYSAPAPAPIYSAPVPAPIYSAPAPAPIYSAPAPAPTYDTPAPLAYPKYDFSYAVKDDYYGNDFGHQESRDGYNTKGNYYVLLPDGRKQRVTYTVNGDSGYVAQVTYEGESQYPALQPYDTPAPAPVYGPPA